MEEKIFNSDFFKKLNNISLNIKLRLSQGAQGGRKSQAKGVSVEFSDFREYVPGDDFRRIDWNAYGRFDRFFVKLFMEEREAQFNFFIDGSKSMDFGKVKKSHTALKITAALSYVVLGNLDRVSINTLKGEQIESSKSLSGKLAFKKMLKDLTAISFDGSTDLNSSIKKANLKKKGVSIIISDFFDSKDLEETLKYLSYKKQQIILLHLLSEEEIKPELYGTLNLVDAENSHNLKVTMSPQVLDQYEKELNKFKKNISNLALKYGAEYIDLCSEDSLEKILFGDLSQRGILFKV